MPIITPKSCKILSFYIICILVLQQVLSQDEDEVLTSRAQSCRTLANKPGKCISVLKCEPIVTLLREEPTVGRQAVAQLRCPGNSEHFRVCCPQVKLSSPEEPEDHKSSEPIQANPNNTQALLPPQCGLSNARHDRVVGGNPSELGAWPWLGILGYGQKSSNRVGFKCGGTLISSRTVITAAHCVHEQNDLRVVRLGEHNLHSKDDGAHPVDYVIKKKIIHPNYNPETSENDVAILKLAEEVPFTDAVHPICLPVTDELKNRNFVRNLPFIAGWGATSWKGSSSAALLEAQVPVVDSNTCKEQYRRVRNAVVDDRVICAGYAQGGKDACQGDSGGPLMFPVKNTYYLIGVVSGGYKCAEAGYPGLYMRVTSFLDFILKYID